MREHLYRGKRIDNGEWVYGDLIKDYLSGQYFIHPYGDSANESDKVGQEGCLMLFTFEVDPETICDYTNLKDKKFSKIFDGDLLKDEYGTTWLMTYAKGWWSYQIVSQNTKVKNHCTVCPYTHIEYGDYLATMEIIGNIYDNPELLEK